ncbi:MAG: hypothetical protein LBV72_17655 [Tannerella sp.]|jgi:DNA-directed RNA polymerase subunit RPC12/RpoP|nr:hypothetical protein [Tannerella sp.]
MDDFSMDATVTNAYKCDGCGAPLVYKPGTTLLICEHCGSTQAIDQSSQRVEESDFNAYIRNFEKDNFTTTKVVTCANCKATPTVDENLKSMSCPYCGSPLIEENVHQERYIKPGYVSPFRVSKDQINGLLGKWVNSLWFAPNKLRKAVLSPLSLHGIYIPFWTFDALTKTDYTGERGDVYYVTVGSGDKKRQERRVKWMYTSGTVRNEYDDVLINGTNTLEHSLITKIEGWDTHNILKINDSYLSGFITEKYQVDLKQAFVLAKQKINTYERNSVERDIGGDEQRVNSMNTQYFNVTFKHVLLPIYVSAFRYKNKLYSFYVNGATGRIAGKRPYSAIKIILTILFVLAIVVIIMTYANGLE